MGNEKSKQKKFDVQSKEQFDKLDLNQDGVLTQDEIRKNILEYKSSEGSKETDLDKMVAATEKKKKEELESQVKDNIGKAVKDLRTKYAHSSAALTFFPNSEVLIIPTLN